MDEDAGLRKRQKTIDFQSRHRTDEPSEEEEELLLPRPLRVARPTQELSFLESFVELIQSFFSFLWSTNCAPNFHLDDRSQSLLQSLKKSTSIPYDSNNEEHNLSARTDLETLWQNSFPEAQYPGTVSPEWKRLGFQSDRPLSDFRGCGLFGMKQILFLSHKYPKSFRKIANLDVKPHPDTDMPFVIASFNGTMLIFELLGFGWKNPGVSTQKNTQTQSKMVDMMFPSDDMDYAIQICHEMFSLIMHLLHVKWSEIAKTFLDFSTVIDQSQASFEEILQQLQSGDDLIRYNKKNFL